MRPITVIYIASLWANLWLLAGTTQAQSTAVAQVLQRPGLNWVRGADAESCISSSSLAHALQDKVPGLVFAGPSAATMFVDGLVQPLAAGGYEAQLWTSDQVGHVLGQRVLRSPAADCRQLDAQLILVLALLLETYGWRPALPVEEQPALAEPPGADSNPPGSEQERHAQPPGTRSVQSQYAQAVSGPRPLTPTRQRAVTGHPWQGAFGLELLAATGLLPEPSAGLGLHGSLGLGGLGELEVQLRVLLPQTVRLPTAQARARFIPAQIGILGCLEDVLWLGAGQPCLAGYGSWLLVDSTGFTDDNSTRSARSSTPGVSAGLVLRWHGQLWGAVQHRLEAGLGLPLLTRRYRYRAASAGETTLLTSPGLMLWLALGLRLRSPF